MRCQHFARRQSDRQQSDSERAAFFKECFLAALPAAIRVSGWTKHDKTPIRSWADHVDLAVWMAHFATEILYPSAEGVAESIGAPQEAG